jgi:hypothetical protein
MRHGSRPNTHRGANGGTCPLPPGRRYAASSGPQARLRLLRQRWARVDVLCRRDSHARDARVRLLAAVAEEPDPQASALRLSHSILLAAEEHGISWAKAASVILDGLAASAEESESAPESELLGVGPDGVPPDIRGAILRRLDEVEA